MTEQHYFTSAPATPKEQTERRVNIRGNEYSVTTANGVFSSERLDKGTAVLLAKAPEPQLEPGQIALDLGCGWGPIALALAAELPQGAVWAVDVNERARDLTHTNAARAGFDVFVAAPQEALEKLGERKIDLLWSNPPIRIGKAELHELLRTWVPRLSETGVAYMVVQKNLGADSLASWMREQGWGCEKVASSKGFRILEVRSHQ